MCKLMEDMRIEYGKEVARDSEIKSAIKTARRYGIAEHLILSDIMKQYNLTEKEAKGYMLKMSA